eukprot:scaffold226386_cov14-Prasinocladus_malaysianus.AAC.1
MDSSQDAIAVVIVTAQESPPDAKAMVSLLREDVRVRVLQSSFNEPGGTSCPVERNGARRLIERLLCLASTVLMRCTTKFTGL